MRTRSQRISQSFDLIAFCPASSTRPGPTVQMMRSLPIPDTMRAANPEEAIRGAVLAHEREILGRDRGSAKRDRAGSRIAYVGEIAAGSRFDTEVVAPVILRDPEAPRIEFDRSQLIRQGRADLRRPIIAAVERRLSELRPPPDHDRARDILQHLLRSSARHLPDLPLGQWVRRSAEELVPDGQAHKTLRLAGSLTSERLARLIVERAWDGSGSGSVEGLPMIWLRPGTPHWGLGSPFVDLVTRLQDKAVSENVGPPILLMNERSEKDQQEVRKAYEHLFPAGFTVGSKAAPQALEILYAPCRWAVVLVREPARGSEFPVPFGVLTREPGVLDAVAGFLDDATDRRNPGLVWASAGREGELWRQLRASVTTRLLST